MARQASGSRIEMRVLGRLLARFYCFEERTDACVVRRSVGWFGLVGWVAEVKDVCFASSLALVVLWLKYYIQKHCKRQFRKPPGHTYSGNQPGKATSGGCAV